MSGRVGQGAWDSADSGWTPVHCTDGHSETILATPEEWAFHKALHATEPLFPETILEEAQRLVMGPKENDYGHPTDDFARTGRIWGAMLGIPDIHPRVVALMCVGIKLSREMNASKRDNRVDIAGYALTAERVVAREEGRE